MTKSANFVIFQVSSGPCTPSLSYGMVFCANICGFSLLTGGVPVQLSLLRQLGKLTKFVYPWMNRRKPYWVDQKADPNLNEDVTPENTEFLAADREENFVTRFTGKSIMNEATRPWLPMETQRCGLVGLKLGIYPMWTKDGRKVDCTLLQVFSFGIFWKLIDIKSYYFIYVVQSFICEVRIFCMRFYFWNNL